MYLYIYIYMYVSIYTYLSLYIYICIYMAASHSSMTWEKDEMGLRSERALGADLVEVERTILLDSIVKVVLGSFLYFFDTIWPTDHRPGLVSQHEAVRGS